VSLVFAYTALKLPNRKVLMPLHTGTLLRLLLPAALIAIALCRRFSHRTKPQTKRRFFKRYGSTLVVMGILGFQLGYFDPKIDSVIEVSLSEPAEEEDSGGPDNPLAHLHRQAKQIRRGMPPERITTYLTPRL
jgi:hypothetical protein